MDVKLSFLGGFIASFIVSPPMENILMSALTASVAALASYVTSITMRFLWSKYRRK